MTYNIQNSDTTKEVRDVARLSISEGFPNKLGDVIMPVVDVNPKHARVCDIVRGNSNTGATAISVYTTPASTEKRDFYLTGFSASLSKDATCDVPSGTVNITVVTNGLTSVLGTISYTTLKAENSNISHALSTPIKLDRNTAIILTATGTITAGVLSKSIAICGFLADG